MDDDIRRVAARSEIVAVALSRIERRRQVKRMALVLFLAAGFAAVVASGLGCCEQSERVSRMETKVDILDAALLDDVGRCRAWSAWAVEELDPVSSDAAMIQSVALAMSVAHPGEAALHWLLRVVEGHPSPLARRQAAIAYRQLRPEKQPEAVEEALRQGG